MYSQGGDSASDAIFFVDCRQVGQSEFGIDTYSISATWWDVAELLYLVANNGKSSLTILPTATADDDIRCPFASLAAHRMSLSALATGKLVKHGCAIYIYSSSSATMVGYRPSTVGINVEIVLVKLPAVSADNGTRCPIASLAAHRVSLSALTAGKLVNMTSTLIPKVIGRRIGVEISWTSMPTVTADDDIQCPIAFLSAHMMPLPAMTAGKLVKTISTLTPTVLR